MLLGGTKMGSVDSLSRLPISHVKPENTIDTLKSPNNEQGTKGIEQLNGDNTDSKIKEKDMENVVKDMNKVLGETHTSLKYEYHEKLEKYYVTLIDDETKETVKEIPPKKLLDMYASMKEYLGLFVDNKI